MIPIPSLQVRQYRSHASINCNGSLVAFLASATVFVAPAKGETLDLSQATAVTSGHQVKFYDWTAQANILWFRDSENKLFAIDIVNNKEVPLHGESYEVIGCSSDHPDILLVLTESKKLVSVSLSTGDAHVVLESDGTWTDFVIDPSFSSCVATRTTELGTEVAHGQLNFDHNNKSLQKAILTKIVRTTEIIKTRSFQKTITTQKVIKSVVDRPSLIGGTKQTPDESGYGSTRVLGFTKDLGSIYMTSFAETEHAHLVLLNLTTKQVEHVVSHPDADISDILVDPSTKSPLAYQIQRVKRTHLPFPSSDRSTVLDLAQLNQQFRHAQWTIASTTADGKTWVLRVADASKPDSYHLFRRDAGGNSPATLLFHEESTSAAAAEAALSEAENMLPCTTRVVEFMNRDGQKIMAYLTLPRQMESVSVSGSGSGGAGEYTTHPLPLVVLLAEDNGVRKEYGSRDGLHQRFAGIHGVAVISPQVRGTRGVGKTLAGAAGVSSPDVAAAQFEDVVDAVNWCVYRGIALQQKVVLYGRGKNWEGIFERMVARRFPATVTLLHPTLSSTYAEELIEKEFSGDALAPVRKAVLSPVQGGSRIDSQAL